MHPDPTWLNSVTFYVIRERRTGVVEYVTRWNDAWGDDHEVIDFIPFPDGAADPIADLKAFQEQVMNVSRTQQQAQIVSSMHAWANLSKHAYTIITDDHS